MRRERILMNTQNVNMCHLKIYRTTSSCASLAWIEKQDYKPVKLDIQNQQTVEIETIVLNYQNLSKGLVSL